MLNKKIAILNPPRFYRKFYYYYYLHIIYYILCFCSSRACQKKIMKKNGSISLYTEERDLALLAAFKSEIASRPILDLDDIFAHIASRVPAPRFYVSEERALLTVKHHLKTGRWLPSSKIRQALFAEIERQALLYIENKEAENLTDAIYLAVNDPAPQFYLTPRTVRTYIYRLTSKNQY